MGTVSVQRSTLGIFCMLCSPTSPEAHYFKTGPTKLMYITNFGLYPYYKNLLIDDLAKTPYIVVMFDESLSEALQKIQMDFIVPIWDDVAKRVQVRFSDCCFLGHTTSQVLLSNFEDAIKILDIPKSFKYQWMDQTQTLSF